MQTTKCICCGVETSEKEKLPILFSKKVTIFENWGFGPFAGAYGEEYYYCENCNQVKVYKSRMNELEAGYYFSHLTREEESKYYHMDYYPNPVGTGVTSIGNPVGMLNEIVGAQYEISKENCMVHPPADIVRIENISEEEYLADEGLIYNIKTGEYESNSIAYSDCETALCEQELDHEKILKKERNLLEVDFGQNSVEGSDTKVYDIEHFIRNTDRFCNLTVDEIVREEHITKGIQLHINKETLDKILKVNNLNKEDLICRGNIKNDVIWDYFKTLLG